MDIAIQHNPDVAGLVWAGVKPLLQAGSAHSNIMKLVSSSLNYITLVIESGEVYERLYIQSAHPLASRLRECLVDQYVKVLIYLACVKKHLQKNIMKRFAERKLSRLLDEVRESGKRVNDYVDLAEKSRLGPLQLIRESGQSGNDSQTTQQRNTSGEPSDGHETRDQISSFLNETRQD
ncbi:hypothetical protein DFP73DRAFT_221573 [Morchella snyderi]|nr:hypothetical protein DFP73DRAFT_221573 [Morchella snyderi]